MNSTRVNRQATAASSKYEALLPLVRRPSRYLGLEINVPEKSWDTYPVRIALAFPDVYEVGMSHLGILLLYDIVNRLDWAAAERVFAPWPDMEALLRAHSLPLVTLESATPLSAFDIVGFSLQYELSYTNVLNMLQLGGIPLRSADRHRAMPVVLGGGPCTFNPEPVAPFFDAFALGDGEELLIEVAKKVRQWKNSSANRFELLEELAQLDGIYVPAFFEPHYLADGRISHIVPRSSHRVRVHKRILPQLEASRPPGKPLVPTTAIVHDRLRFEVVRGCSRGCRFCQAGYIYRPVRERSAADLLSSLQQALAATGYDEVSLLALSIGDYSCIHQVLRLLMKKYSSDHLAVSLPSLRVGTLDKEMIAEVDRVRKTGFTLAPEAGSHRLRHVINKAISEPELLETVEAVYQAGWPLLKLYFMMGLPTETKEDRQALVDLALKVWQQAASCRPARRLHVSISTFVPKPHTPFQWESQMSLAEMRHCLQFFKKQLRRKGLSFKWNQPYQSMLEGVFSRGDRRLANVLLTAYQLGCRFDGWSDQLRAELWQRAFAANHLEPEFYCERPRDRLEVLPWEHLDCGVDPEYLWKEYQKAMKQTLTPDCRQQGCTSCGVCDHQQVRPQLRLLKEEESQEVAMPGQIQPSDPHEKRCWFVIRYAKQGVARFLSHLETVNVFRRALKRAALPLCYSEGYHPVPRLSFGNALPLGMESRVEEMEVLFYDALPPEEIAVRLNSQLPTGLEVVQVSRKEKHQPNRAYLVTYEAVLSEQCWPMAGFLRFNKNDLAPLRQKSKKGDKEISLQNRLRDLVLVTPDTLRFGLLEGINGNIRVRDLLCHLFEVPEEVVATARIVKTSAVPVKGL
ncbi:MAG: TIGR03960 family B12-binding radical SAM protein [Deltaproteobacteria bacterium]|nr:TIGR03960 family B12-binding radical SAM protein [Deltaproteobacteria bacterium]MBW2069760.1 TIGR03960 family B12-binding radical SAM protein [Deltaproteobacteria bacterium]